MSLFLTSQQDFLELSLVPCASPELSAQILILLKYKSHSVEWTSQKLTFKLKT